VERLKPTYQQQKAINKLFAESEKTSAALNASTMGAGKTLIAVEVAKKLKAQTILVIAPLGTRLGWRVTFERQGVKLPFRWINSTKDGKSAMADWEWQLPGIYFVGVEYFTRKAYNGNVRTKIWTHKPDMVMFDEAHRGQNRDSKTYKSLKQVSGGYKLSMSGTPTGNRFEGAWAVCKWLWPELIENSFHTWVDRWCKTEYDHFAPRNRKIVGEKNPGSFFSALPCYVRIESELNVDLVQDVRYVELLSAQRKAYNQLEENMITWIEGNPLVVEFPITLRARLRQASLGMFSVNADGDVSFADDCKSSKIDAMLEILEDDWDGEPALILTDSRKFADVVVCRLNAQGHSASAWHGEVSQAEREIRKKAFIDGGIRYLVAVSAAIAEGVDGLQHATRNILWLSRSDNRLLNEQAMARVMRQGQTRQVRSVEIVGIDTYDSGVLSSHMTKAIEMNKILKERRD
jgi:superfamily II DNA or RNA helicase